MEKNSQEEEKTRLSFQFHEEGVFTNEREKASAIPERGQGKVMQHSMTLVPVMTRGVLPASSGVLQFFEAERRGGPFFLNCEELGRSVLGLRLKTEWCEKGRTSARRRKEITYSEKALQLALASWAVSLAEKGKINSIMGGKFPYCSRKGRPASIWHSSSKKRTHLGRRIQSSAKSCERI